MSVLDGLLDPRIRIAHGDPRANWPVALPAEEAAIAGAVASRRREFRAGRAVARQAMRGLAVTPAAIPVRDDRSPVWPEGIVGSISHCDDLCVAAVGSVEDGWLAIGIDVEPRAPLPPELVAEVCGAEEQKWLAEQQFYGSGELARLIFCAKECVYKAQYALSHRLFGFDVLTIRIDPENARFTARFARNAAPFLAGDELEGRYAMDAAHIVAAIALRREHLTASAPRRQEVLPQHG